MNDFGPIVIEVDGTNIQIPECCREGWDDCPHTAKPERAKKRNIGL